jgi:hypothetical protein
VIQLAGELFGTSLEGPFLEKLAQAPSNLPEFGDGRGVWERLVRPAEVDWQKIGAHYAVSSLFEPYEREARLFCYRAERLDDRTFEAGRVKLVVGEARLTSEVTEESQALAYGALHFGDHNVTAGVRPFDGPEAHRARVADFAAAFAQVDVAQIVRALDRHFGESTYSLASLFRDEQRKVLKRVLRGNVSEAMAAYGKLYEQNLPLMRFLKHLGVPLPRAFQVAAEQLFNTDLRWAFADDEPDFDHIRRLVEDARAWGVPLDARGLGYRFGRMLARTAERWREAPLQADLLQTLAVGVELARTLPFEPNLWKVQNVYVELAHTAFPRAAEQAQLGDPAAREWLDRFVALGDRLGVQTDALKKKSAA